MDRRDVLKIMGAGVVGASLPSFARATAPFPSLTARAGLADLGLPSGQKTPIWGYEGQVPGPVLRFPQGDRLQRQFVNNLEQPSTIHWHGIRIANAMDGVPKMTQNLVKPGETFEYDFVLPDAGTYWYHPHNRTWEQAARGLYGALIIDEKTPPPVDRDEVLLIDDWRIDDQGVIHEESFGSRHDWSHGGRLGNWVTINGKSQYAVPTKEHERLRLRLVNTANARIFTLGLTGLAGWVVALDGQPLDQPEPLIVLNLAPAQRVDVIVDVVTSSGDTAALYALVGDQRIVIGDFPVEGSVRAERLPKPAPLPANPVPPLGDLGTARRVKLLMQGGAMAWLGSAKLGDETLDGRALAERGKFWAFNGRADMPKEPLVSAGLGETIRIVIENASRWPHAMHLHGHHFRELKDGTPGPLRDTILIDGGDQTEIAFVADNPGKWLFHCHMLEHAASGMRTWIEVG